MARLFTALLLALAPLQAAALSCLPWHVERAYVQARDSSQGHVVVRGWLAFDQDAFPEVDWARQQDVPPETQIPAVLEGEMLGRDGSRQPFSEQVTLTISCAGPWCPSLTAGDEVLAFVRLSGDRYELQQGACGGMVFARPDKKTLDRVDRCLNDGRCTPPQP